MFTKEGPQLSKHLSIVRNVRLSRSEWEGPEPPPPIECEVVEYDAQNGQTQWDDAVFVQDFTDSVLATSPAPLNSECDDAQ